jgi:CubicO group peptidase (beta-lactamase class C family)
MLTPSIMGGYAMKSLLAALAFLVAAPVLAAPVPAPVTHPLNASDLEAYFDGFVPYALARGDIAGAEIVVVKDGKVLFAKGYGVADMKSAKPVDPAHTLFRPGSISKLFTWTAVMQQVEAGKLDLDTDVNTYLDFTIPKPHGKPVTLRALMTHQPGFEDSIKGLFTEDPKRMPTLGTGLKAWVPDQIFAPGAVPAYSNYGAALAGYIVERVSHERFEVYVDRHILAPLGMAHSSFVQPVPKALAADLSSGYGRASQAPKKFEYIWMSPAGALSTTGEDIAKFMLAYLGGGEYAGGRILKPETVRLMHSEIDQRNPPLPGMGLGFYHEDANGRVIVGHGGDTMQFHSDLHLIPSEGVGFYYSQNSAGKEHSSLRRPLFAGFLNRYFPAPPIGLEPTLKTAGEHGALIAGYYDTSRRSDSSFLRIASQQIKVSVNADGTISADQFVALNGEPYKWREVKPFVWREVGGTHLLLARVKDGAVTEIASDMTPQIVTMTRASALDSAAWNMPLLIATLTLLTLTVVFWPVKAILRWRYDTHFSFSGRAAWLYRGTRLVALVDLVFLGGYLGALVFGMSHIEFLDARLDPVILALQCLGVIAIVGAIVPLLELRQSLFDRTRPWWTKLTDAMNLLACLAVVWCFPLQPRQFPSELLRSGHAQDRYRHRTRTAWHRLSQTLRHALPRARAPAARRCRRADAVRRQPAHAAAGRVVGAASLACRGRRVRVRRVGRSGAGRRGRRAPVEGRRLRRVQSGRSQRPSSRQPQHRTRHRARSRHPHAGRSGYLLLPRLRSRLGRPERRLHPPRRYVLSAEIALRMVNPPKRSCAGA